MAESRQAGPQGAKQAEGSIEENRRDTADDRNLELTAKLPNKPSA